MTREEEERKRQVDALVKWGQQAITNLISPKQQTREAQTVLPSSSVSKGNNSFTQGIVNTVNDWFSPQKTTTQDGITVKPKSAYQRLMETPIRTKWYKGDQPTSSEMLEAGSMTNGSKTMPG